MAGGEAPLERRLAVRVVSHLVVNQYGEAGQRAVPQEQQHLPVAQAAVPEVARQQQTHQAAAVEAVAVVFGSRPKQ
jgi:hypothetical protein